MEQESNRATDAETGRSRTDQEVEGEGEEHKYSSVTIKPTKPSKMSALERIKAIQENDWKTWKGP